MGCFFPKKQSKVVQGDHQHGSKSDHMSNNKPVVLPDPDNVAREQSPRGTQGKNRVTKWGRGKNDTVSLPRSDSNSSSGLIGQFPRARSVPHDYTFDDPASINGDGFSSAASMTPFSAPLPSRLPGLDITSSPSAASNLVPGTYRSSPVCWIAPPNNETEGESINSSLEKRSSFSDRLDRKTFGGRPLRLPKPLTAGHPLPLPYSPERSEVGSVVLSSALATPVGASPSPSRGRDGYMAYNQASVAMHKSTDAKPLPPPALSTESRSPVRGFSYAEFAQLLTPEFMLWDGVHGTAYRASVEDGENKKIEVAVVCMVSKSLQGPKEWIAEVNWLARLQNPRLCKLIGYCAEDTAVQECEVVPRRSRRLLVYEYMSNGSLEKYLGGKVDCQLDWATRMKIALDVAQGLAYLHDKAPFQVICRDLCPGTIQVDSDLRTKLSGFGLARCGPEGDQGSPMAGPYAAPESSANGVVTRKSNAWSFGVMLLELLTGRRHMDTNYAKDQQNLIQLTKPYLRDKSKLFHIIDSELNGRYSLRGAVKLANLAFQCLQKEASLRPNLSEAVEVLKMIQVDEDAVAADFKKSRSFSVSLTSPVTYSRSTSDILLRHNNEGKNSGELKQRDRESQRTTVQPGSVGSSPSYSELRQTGDLKQRDREFQRLAIHNGMVSSPAKDDTVVQMNELKQQEREPQRLSTSTQALPLTDSKKQLSDSKQIEHELRKLATGSRLCGKVQLKSHDGQMISTPQLTDPVQPLDIRQHSQEAEQLPVPTQPLQTVESSDKKDQGAESEMCDSSTGPLEESQGTSKMEDASKWSISGGMPTQSDEKCEGHDSVKPTVSTASTRQQVPEMQKAVRSSAANRASCAPALIFGPPMLSQAF